MQKFNRFNLLKLANRSLVRRVAGMQTSRITISTISQKLYLHQSSFISQETKLKEQHTLSRKPIGGSQAQNNGPTKSFDNVEFMAPASLAFFLVVGGLSYYIFEQQKKKMDAKQSKESHKGYGTPDIGGEPFSLLDHNGNEFTDNNLLGKFSLVYFGFSHCPDICPDELDKLGVWLDELSKDKIEVQPIFISCDPNRDSPKVLKDYLQDFHEGIIGLTGTYAEIKKVCKQYRVYFSTPENVKPGEEYLVDHSIFFYLMDPNGKFITILGRNLDEVTGVDKIRVSLDEWKSANKRKT